MAKYSAPAIDLSFLADADFNSSSPGLGRFVVAASTAGYVKLASTLAGSVMGVLQNNPKAGREATVRVFGGTKVLACAEGSSSPITYGGFIKCASNGQALGADKLSACSFVVGVALEALASSSGVYIEAFLFPPGGFRTQT